MSESRSDDGDWTVLTALIAAYDAFRDNFITQFSYNPLFGNMRVDLLTTGQGTYVHSLLSLLTHLGLVGFTLFVLFLRSLYLQIARPDQRLQGELKKSYLLFRLFALVAILLAGLVSAFFVWTPLWFCVGLFAFGSNAPLFASPKPSRAAPSPLAGLSLEVAASNVKCNTSLL